MEPSCTPSTPLDPAVEIVQGVPAVQIVQGIPTVSDWETRIPCQGEEGQRMTMMRSALDKTVDKLVQKLNQNHFIKALPQGLKREFATALQSKLCSVFKTHLCKEIEDSLSEDGYADKLNRLDDIIHNTLQSVSVAAWRPSSIDTVENSVIAHDLEVSLQHKEKLGLLVAEAEAECQELVEQIQLTERRLRDNQIVLNNMEKLYSNITENIVVAQNVSEGPDLA
ncbi:uncharacterized protein LOC111696167 [Eurytemora carolleeae]|uniref:uncharacterized protein LOC111696167 n=1 Tax=Eurytemora carolleeae TaxID=1294199 RepID=UPI000C794DB8|nr:uncharacterized protein LOC111696167 [Eurytemora carolleeae]XP_023321485.1 uncharacterized protein LOC111696167 [Eurytemora carolleeae]|eukprot:XP_023321484.1 uncharacterized protein LOC111696167 [Eurytemora affinis]